MKRLFKVSIIILVFFISFTVFPIKANSKSTEYDQIKLDIYDSYEDVPSIFVYSNDVFFDFKEENQRRVFLKADGGHFIYEITNEKNQTFLIEETINYETFYSTFYISYKDEEGMLNPFNGYTIKVAEKQDKSINTFDISSSANSLYRVNVQNGYFEDWKSTGSYEINYSLVGVTISAVVGAIVGALTGGWTAVVIGAASAAVIYGIITTLINNNIPNVYMNISGYERYFVLTAGSSNSRNKVSTRKETDFYTCPERSEHCRVKNASGSIEDSKVISDHTINGYQEGWTVDGNKYMFYKNEGPHSGRFNYWYLTGWIYTDGGYFYLNPSDGVMRFGWLAYNGEEYYLNPRTYNDSGRMQVGWKYVNGGWFYLNPGTNNSDGKALYGWQKINGDWYYLKPRPSGRMVTGWLELNGYKYYLIPGANNDNGRMCSGFCYIDAKKYYFIPGPTGDDGRMATQSMTINGEWYTISSNGEVLN